MRIIIILLLMTQICSAGNLYVTLEGNEPKGTISASGRIKLDWEKDFTLIPVGEEFRGKQPHEIKYEDGKVRLATQQEIDIYLQQQEQVQEEAKKQRVLDTLGLTEQDIEKVKKLKDE